MILGAVRRIPDRDTSPPECMAAGSWGMEIGEQFWAKAAVDYWEMAQGDEKEEICDRKCLWRKGSQPRRQDATAESHVGVKSLL